MEKDHQLWAKKDKITENSYFQNVKLSVSFVLFVFVSATTSFTLLTKGSKEGGGGGGAVKDRDAFFVYRR